CFPRGVRRWSSQGRECNGGVSPPRQRSPGGPAVRASPAWSRPRVRYARRAVPPGSGAVEAHLLWVQEVGGSSPPSPTTHDRRAGGADPGRWSAPAGRAVTVLLHEAPLLLDDVVHPAVDLPPAPAQRPPHGPHPPS